MGDVDAGDGAVGEDEAVVAVEAEEAGVEDDRAAAVVRVDEADFGVGVADVTRGGAGFGGVGVAGSAAFDDGLLG